MKSIVDLLKHNQRVLVQSAVETFLTSSWSLEIHVAPTNLDKIFSGLFTNLCRDLEDYQTENHSNNLSSFFLAMIKNQSQIRNKFDLQLAILGIARSVITHFMTHLKGEGDNHLEEYFSIIQRIFDSSLIQLSYWWKNIYDELRKDDRLLIDQLRTVKDGLQRHLNLIYQLLRESPVAIAGCDQNYSVQHWNPMAAKLTHYEPADILNKNILTLFADGVRHRIQNKLQTEKKSVWKMQVTLKRKDGSQFPAFVSISNVKNVQFAQFCYIISFLDITAQIQFKSSRQHFNQVMAISRLSSAIMHDIRNPLHALGINLELIEQQLAQRNLEKEEVFLRPLERIRQELQVLNQHLNQYLTYSQIVHREFEPIELIGLLGSLARELYFELSQRKIKFSFHLPEQAMWIQGDWHQLRRVFLNLIQNASEALGKTGEIGLNARRKASRVLVHVTDNGSGIPEALKGKIFEPFFTTKDSGSGLGLFICKEIVKTHRGRITFRSRPGQGTCFTVSIPLLKPDGGPVE